MTKNQGLNTPKQVLKAVAKEYYRIESDAYVLEYEPWSELDKSEKDAYKRAVARSLLALAEVTRQFGNLDSPTTGNEIVYSFEQIAAAAPLDY